MTAAAAERPSRVPHVLDPRARNEYPRLFAGPGSLHTIRVVMWGMVLMAVVLVGLFVRLFFPAESTVGNLLGTGTTVLMWGCGAVMAAIMAGPAYGAWQALRHSTAGEGTDWSYVPLHWTDWRLVKDCSHDPEQVRRFYFGPRTLNAVTRLPVVCALLDTGASLPVNPDQRRAMAAFAGWYPVLRLVKFGVPFEAVLTLCRDWRQDATHVIHLLDRLPDLTAADLTRFTRGGLFRDANSDVDPVLRAEVLIRDLTERNGPLASHFYAMNMSAAEIAAARASGVTGEQLEVLAGLSR